MTERVPATAPAMTSLCPFRYLVALVITTSAPCSSGGSWSRSGEHTSGLQSHSFNSYAVFFFNDTATAEISPLPLHDALPIYDVAVPVQVLGGAGDPPVGAVLQRR